MTLTVLLDLDNTLVDRAGAFARWAAAFTAESGADADALRWLLEADGDGYTPRAELAGRIRSRFGLAADVPSIVERLRLEVTEGIALYPGVADRLEELGERGARRVIVTNGSEAQQTRKIRMSGLEPLVDGVVVSEAVGVAKPDPEIFRRALRIGGGSDGRSWMVGDHAENDVDGAARCGVLTAWVSHGRPWPASLDRPLIEAATTAEALDVLLATAY